MRAVTVAQPEYLFSCCFLAWDAPPQAADDMQHQKGIAAKASYQHAADYCMRTEPSDRLILSVKVVADKQSIITAQPAFKS